uniref:Uncharacterized protein LOC117369295 isoform X2 n=1 Tax=Geotrypetes seraphini TaxID=260995 RepID=A0A6P8T086_GEOSA|nr:uncharacterized protein LOC117369295 isoform X2 [Geotrypetes seraphini]
MEEAPQGTFKDELEWCIRQLERGLLRLNPTPKQGETQRILKVLQSRKAPFVKKRQLMNRVFGDYRQKISNERQQMEKSAAKAMAVKIQECNSKNSGSVAYRKYSSESTETKGNWFIPSDNDFRFDFFPCDTISEVINIGLENVQGEGDHGQTYADGTASNLVDIGRHIFQNKILNCLTSGSQGSEFAFNFLIPEEESSVLPSNSKDLQMGNALCQVAPLMSPYLNPEVISGNMVPSENSVSQDLGREEGELRQLEMKEKEALNFENTVKNKKAADVPKKKKKKSSQNKKAVEKLEDGEKVKVGSIEHPDKDICPQDEASQLRKEIDWCVEQLELGLQRQKSTPKQVDEALRAIKILKSEKAPLVKKRQVMRGLFGDYRKKMEEERQKQLRLMQAATKSALVTSVKDQTQMSRSRVYRKCTWIAEQGRSSAGFNAPQMQTALPENTTISQLPQDHVLSFDIPRPVSFIFTPSLEPFCFNFF